MSETTGSIVRLDRVRRCDFCGKDQHHVAVLLVAPEGVADICDECIAVCAEAVEDTKAKRRENPNPNP